MSEPSAPISNQFGTASNKNEFRDNGPVKLAVMILAKDEERNIGRTLDSIAAQDICYRNDIDISVYVVANGSTDRTAVIAREHAAGSLQSLGIHFEVFDWVTPGKSRSWNRVVHEVIPVDVEFILALDADIAFANNEVLSTLHDHLKSNSDLEVVSGFAVKDTLRKANPTMIERFSNSISRHTRHSGVINGSLYLAKAYCLREIWLPDDTPGEDGFLNAMVMTRGFSQPERAELVDQLPEPTHYFEDHSALGYFAHEKRMLVGTMINRWIFEYLNSLELNTPAGKLIERLNREEPDWVEKIIANRSTGNWLIPRALMFRRLVPKAGISSRYLIRLPILLLATALTLPPAFNANKALKRRGASAFW